MKDAIQHVEPDSAVTVDTGEETFTAKEVAQDIEASRSWVYAHADELGGYRVGRRAFGSDGSAPKKKWDAKNPSEHKDRRRANENESLQRRDAAASLPPGPGLPCITDRAESIPLSLLPLFRSRYPLSGFHSPFPLRLHLRRAATWR
jgi:hypothetical protein